MTPAIRNNNEPSEFADRHILTFVIEDYFQVGAFNAVIPRSHWRRFDTRLVENTRSILAMLAATKNTATFFCCGWVADNYPQLLREVVEAGHELGCQTYYPTPVSEFTPASLKTELKRSRDAFIRATGCLPNGFRVGRGWIASEQLWVLDVLAEAGFDYDSSIVEIGTQFFGQSGFSELGVHATSGDREIYEVPISSLKLAGLGLPIAGGNYFRQSPETFIRNRIKRWIDSHSSPLVAYFHVWEIDGSQPAIDAAHWLQRVRHYRNLGDMKRRLENLLQDYRFTSVSQYLDLALRQGDADTIETKFELPTDELKSQVHEKMAMTLAVPCYNEEATLPYLNKALMDFSLRFDHLYELRYLFVDDGSKDATLAKLQEYFGDRPECLIVQHPENRGIAAGILTAIENSTTELVTILDADCTFDPLQLPNLSTLMKDNIDMVAASPLHPEGEMVNVPGWRLLMSKGAAFLYRRVLRHKFFSYTSCFRIYRRSSVLPMALLDHGFCGVTEIFVRMDMNGARIVECPAVLEVRLLGQSKINTLKTIFEHLRLVARVFSARVCGGSLKSGEAQ